MPRLNNREFFLVFFSILAGVIVALGPVITYANWRFYPANDDCFEILVGSQTPTPRDLDGTFAMYRGSCWGHFEGRPYMAEFEKCLKR